MDDRVSLREFIEAKLAAVRLEMDWRAGEINRRLDELNHAHDQHMDLIARTVPRETWELRNTDVDRRFEQRANDVDVKFANGMRRFEAMDKAITAAVAAARGKAVGISDSWGVTVAVLTIILAAVAVFLK